MKTLNEQYRLIKEDKGHKGMFLTEAKRQFPNYVRNAATFNEAEKVLKQKGIITENFTGLEPISSPFSAKELQPYEIAFTKFLEEAKSPEIKAKEIKAKKLKSQEDEEKAELKKPSDQVEDDLEHGYDNKDNKNIDNLIFDQVMTGYYAELKDPKNSEKTMEQLKDIVLKNLAKDPIFYTKDGQFGVKGLGYTTEHPGLGEPKEPKGKFKSSGYGDLQESHQPGDKVIYKGTSYEVVDEDEFVITLRDKNSKEIEVNYNQFKQGETTPTQPNMKEGIKRNYPNYLSGEYQGEEERLEGDELYTYLVDTMAFSKNEDDFVNKVTYGLTDKTSSLSPEDEQKLRTWYEKNKETKDMNLQETKLRKVINTIIREELAKKPLNENVDKRLKEIEAEAAVEAMGSKLEKIMAEIEKRQMQLGKLDEDEDLKAMMDKKATGKIQKEIKLLEKAKAKVEKLMGKGKGNKKEVIDEAGDDESKLVDAINRAEELYDETGTLEDALSETPEELKNEVERHLTMAYGL